MRARSASRNDLCEVRYPVSAVNRVCIGPYGGRAISLPPVVEVGLDSGHRNYDAPAIHRVTLRLKRAETANVVRKIGKWTRLRKVRLGLDGFRQETVQLQIAIGTSGGGRKHIVHE